MAREIGKRPVVCGVGKAQKGKCLKNDGVMNCCVSWLLTGLVGWETKVSVGFIKLEITSDLNDFFFFFFLKGQYFGGNVRCVLNEKGGNGLTAKAFISVGKTICSALLTFCF